MPPPYPSSLRAGTALCLRDTLRPTCLRLRLSEHFQVLFSNTSSASTRHLSTLLNYGSSQHAQLRQSLVTRLPEANRLKQAGGGGKPEARRWKSSRGDAALESLLEEQRAAEKEARRLRSIKWTPSDRDEGIASRFILVLDERRNQLTRQLLSAVLQRMDRKNEILIKVGMSNASHAHGVSDVDAGHRDQYGRGGPGADEMLPLCKVLSKKEHFAKQKQRAEAANAAARERRRRAGKTVELGWATAAGDLEHRLRKARSLLEHGEGVTFVIENRRKRTVVPDDDARALLDAVARAMAEVPGVVETAREGTMGGNYKVGYGPKATSKG